jgi:hypothetical protein
MEYSLSSEFVVEDFSPKILYLFFVSPILITCMYILFV